MIIQCKQCETTYRFDSAHLHDAEVKVRCVRCGNVFGVDAQSDLGEDFITPEPVSMGPQSQTGAETPAEPASVFSFTDTKLTASPPASDSSARKASSFKFNADGDDDFWTSSEELSLDDSSAARSEIPLEPETAPTNAHASKTEAPDTNEFIFEPMHDESDGTPPGGVDENMHIDVEAAESGTAATAATSAQKKKTSKLLLFVLFLVLIGAGIYAYYYLVHGAASMSQIVTTIEKQISEVMGSRAEPVGPSIRIQTGDNFYINNTHLGAMFVINGTVTNVSKHPQGEIAVVVTLYSSNGNILRSIKTYGGNPISKEALRTEPLETIQKQMSNKLGAGLSNVSVQPGESIPFCTVFHDLPENFAEFSISEAPGVTTN